MQEIRCFKCLMMISLYAGLYDLWMLNVGGNNVLWCKRNGTTFSILKCWLYFYKRTYWEITVDLKKIQAYILNKTDQEIGKLIESDSHIRIQRNNLCFRRRKYWLVDENQQADSPHFTKHTIYKTFMLASQGIHNKQNTLEILR